MPRQVLGACHHGLVRRVEPDHRKEGSALLRRGFDELERAIHDERGVVTSELVLDLFPRTRPIGRPVRLPGPRVHHRVVGRDLRLRREAHVEAVLPWRRVVPRLPRTAAVRVFLLRRQGPEVPLPEVACRVADLLEVLSEGVLFRWEASYVRVRDPIPARVPAREDAPTRRAADRRRCVEAMKGEPALRHQIQLWRERRRSWPHVPPAHVVRHHQDNIGTERGSSERAAAQTR